MFKNFFNRFFFSEYEWFFEVLDDTYLMPPPSHLAGGRGRKARRELKKWKDAQNKIKELSFDYYYYGTNYWDAHEKCVSLGEGWKLAGFQSYFDLTSDGSLVKNNDLYWKSVKNIESV